MNCSAAPMMSSEFRSASPELAPQAVMPCPPRITPIASGRSRWIAAMSSPSWNPGLRHAVHATRSPNACRVSASPSAAVANAIPASGWRWSTWAASTRPCIAVSIDGAAPPRPNRQWSNAATISSSCSTPG
jgi:hypothetical protein